MSRKYKCKHCGEYKEESIKLPVGRFCCFDHATEWARKKSERDFMRKLNKEAKEAEKAVRAKQRERKKALKRHSDYIAEAQAAVNAYIRIRDANKPCISCGATPKQKRGGTIDAGHYRSRGAAGHLRFNVFNIAGQCVTCNRYKSGNAVDYRIELIRRIGVERVERLESDNVARKFTVEYLERIKRIFNKKARLYKRFRNE